MIKIISQISTQQKNCNEFSGQDHSFASCLDAFCRALHCLCNVVAPFPVPPYASWISMSWLRRVKTRWTASLSDRTWDALYSGHLKSSGTFDGPSGHPSRCAILRIFWWSWLLPSSSPWPGSSSPLCPPLPSSQSLALARPALPLAFAFAFAAFAIVRLAARFGLASGESFCGPSSLPAWPAPSPSTLSVALDPLPEMLLELEVEVELDELDALTAASDSTFSFFWASASASTGSCADESGATEATGDAGATGAFLFPMALLH